MDRNDLIKPMVSVVIPYYNEQQSLSKTISRLASVFSALDVELELVLVDDGSQDKSTELAVSVVRNLADVKCILLVLSRNFGKEAALSAGIDASTGEAVIPFDADLQDPPDVIRHMLEKWRQGYEVVYGVRSSRQGESILKKATAHIFYRLIAILSDTKIPNDTGDFRLMDRKVVEAIKSLPERSRFMKGLFTWVGFRQTSVYYERKIRISGNSKWNYWKLWNLAIDAITSFSTVPLQLIGGCGFAIAIGAIAYSLIIIIRTFILGIDVPGYASLMTAVLLLGGIQLIGIGALGEYTGRIFKEAKRRPIYIISHTWHQ